MTTTNTMLINIHSPNQRGHLEKFINAKENITEIFTREFLTIDHWKITLHALQIEIMDQSGVKPHINVAIKI